MRLSRVEKPRRKFVEVSFDGMDITATAESARVIKVHGCVISEADLHAELAIHGGEGFVAGAYRIHAVDQANNTLTLDRSCSAGPASGLLGKMARYQGKPHDEVVEYYDPTLPNKPIQEERDRVLGMLNHVEPRILKSLADTCLKDQLLVPEYLNDGDWPPDSCQHLLWGHIKTAGDVTAGGQSYYNNLRPLREELARWAAGGPERAWNLLDNEKRPLEWIASAAVQTLVWWKMRGGLPKILQWEHLELHAYRKLETPADFRMFDLEAQFNRGAGFLNITGGNVQEQQRLSDREQRQAKREYVRLAKKRGLKPMPGKVSPHYFKWYVQHTFLGLRLKEIRQMEMDRRATGIGDPKDPEDLASVSMGIKRIAELVGFRRQSRQRTEKI